MAWVDGIDLTTGDLVTEADWNNYLGADGSIDYLKTETDKIDDISQAQPARVLGTVYQNTSGKTRVVTVSVSNGGTSLDTYGVFAFVGASSPPTTGVGDAKSGLIDPTASGQWCCSVTFIVMPNYYYRVTDEGTGSTSLSEWTEWDLH